jgi:5-formyltetrahydrofolate cyclo-ligase
MTKADLRASGRARRSGCDPGWGLWLAGHVLGSGLIPPAASVAGFWPMAGEIDIRPLLLALLGRGHVVLLPETPPRGHPLVFRHWRPGVTMLRGPFGTVHPHGPPGTPTLLLVPLLAFDARCNRLGYGGGYYDRTIAALPGVRSIGCAFAAQQVDEVPVLPHDARLDAVATERGVILNPER